MRQNSAVDNDSAAISRSLLIDRNGEMERMEDQTNGGPLLLA